VKLSNSYRTLINIMKNRRSTRRYKTTRVPVTKILKILKAGGFAPSGANQQPWNYIIVDDPELKKKIRKEAEKEDKTFHRSAPLWLQKWLKDQNIGLEKTFLTNAPFLIVVVGDSEQPYWCESVWLSIAYIILAAQSEDLATLTYTPGSTKFLNKILEIPKRFKVLAIIPIGQPFETHRKSEAPRKKIEDIVFYNKYGDKIR